MDQQLMLGILLIIVGVAIGLIAVAVILNRRGESADEAAGESAEGSSASAEDATNGSDSEAASEAEALEDESQTPTGETDGAGATAADEADHDDESESAADSAEPEAELATAPADLEPEMSSAEAQPQTTEVAEPADTPEPPPGTLSADTLLGELHRDPVTGAVVIRHQEREFRSAAEITEHPQHQQLASAATDLSAWFQQATEKPARAAKPGKPKAPSPAPSTSGMVQAIDAILQRSLENSPAANRGVRLTQDASGGVKVLIGVKSYEVDQVPDDEIRRLIRQAVAEWEAHQ